MESESDTQTKISLLGSLKTVLDHLLVIVYVLPVTAAATNDASNDTGKNQKANTDTDANHQCADLANSTQI